MRKICFLVVVAALVFCGVNASAASGGQDHGEGFNAGEYVIHHVSDSYEWHIITIDETHISIPLPIIVYSKARGLNIFLSSKFHHGHSAYNGFKIETEGPREGRIVEVLDDGTTDALAPLPFDLSITKTVAGILISVVLMLIIFISVGRSAKRNCGEAPHGLQNLIEPIVLFIRDEVVKPAIGEEKYESFMPYLLTLFFFILFNNLMGLVPIIPFGANVTGNISVTMSLALLTFALTTIRGNKHYWKEVFNPDVPWWLKYPIPLMPLIEFSGMIIKPVVLMIRLFANMMAGHLIISIFIGLIFIFSSLFGAGAGYGVAPLVIFFSLFMTLLDVLVSFIQAYVFVFLSALYFGMATSEHH